MYSRLSEYFAQERLERELEGEDYRKLLEQLQQENPFFRRFQTWVEVLAFMRQGTSHDSEKDEVLRPIFLAQQCDGDARWRTVLLNIFWPALESIDWQKRSWDSDPDERRQNLVLTFFKVVSRIDARKRSDRLVQKVFNDTVHHLHDVYRRIWRRMEHETCVDLKELGELAGGIDEIRYSAVEREDASEAEIGRFRAHLQNGRLSETDFLLLVGTRVYGKPLADYARESGLSYQAAKKRRQRAEASLRNL